MADVGLRRNAIGLREVLFQSITDMAPGAAIAAPVRAMGLDRARAHVHRDHGEDRPDR
jgi:hypothetical protein